jgi:hypothetical protein
MKRKEVLTSQLSKTLLQSVFLLVILGLGFSSCRPSKDTTKRVTKNDVRKLDTFLHQNTPFKTLDAKVDFRFNAKAGIGASMKGFIRMSKDSCIILSVQPFAGIEAVRCLIVKDSIILVSRLHQIYAVETLNNLTYKDFLNISTLQDLLTNRIFVPGDLNLDERKLARFDQLKQKEASGYRWSEDSFILDFLMNKDDQYYKLKAFKPESKETVTVNYAQFKEEVFGLFPRQVDVSTAALKQNISMQITFSKPTFDGRTDFKFDIPAKYKRVSSTDLIKRFQDML